MIQADAYFFDIDGTLLVTKDLVHWNALHSAMLEVFGIDTTIEGLPYHGKTDVGILRMALARCGVTEAAFNSRLADALQVVCREVSLNCTGLLPAVCPAIPELLEQIRSQRKLLGVASGNLESVGWSKVRAAGLREFFELGSFGDQHEFRTAIFDHAVQAARKKLGSSARVCFVGDTPDDIRAARDVGAKVVAVATGTFAFEDLAALSPDVCCHSCLDAMPHLR